MVFTVVVIYTFFSKSDILWVLILLLSYIYTFIIILLINNKNFNNKKIKKIKNIRRNLKLKKVSKIFCSPPPSKKGVGFGVKMCKNFWSDRTDQTAL